MERHECLVLPLDMRLGTPLLFLVRNATPGDLEDGGGFAELLRGLVSRGALLDLADEAGFAPLHEACRAGNVALARLLLELGAPVDQIAVVPADPASASASSSSLSSSPSPRSRPLRPLELAARANALALVQLLLESGASLDLLQSELLARHADNAPLVELLLRHAASARPPAPTVSAPSPAPAPITTGSPSLAGRVLRGAVRLLGPGPLDPRDAATLFFPLLEKDRTSKDGGKEKAPLPVQQAQAQAQAAGEPEAYLETWPCLLQGEGTRVAFPTPIRVYVYERFLAWHGTSALGGELACELLRFADMELVKPAPLSAGLELLLGQGRRVFLSALPEPEPTCELLTFLWRNRAAAAAGPLLYAGRPIRERISHIKLRSSSSTSSFPPPTAASS